MIPAPLGRELARQRVRRETLIRRMLRHFAPFWLDADPPTWEWPR